MAIEKSLAIAGSGLAVFAALFAGISKFNSLENRVSNLESQLVEVREAVPASAPQGLPGRERQCWDIVYHMARAARAKDDEAMNRLTMMSGKFGCGYAAQLGERHREAQEAREAREAQKAQEAPVSNTDAATM
jgi:hypothetical protein